MARTHKKGAAKALQQNIFFRLPDGTEISGTMERKRVKNLNLRLRADGTLYLSMPLRLSFEEGERFLAERTDFILRAYQRQRKIREEAEKRGPAPRALENGDRLPYLGRSLTLRITTGAKRGVVLQGEELHVTLRAGDGREVCARLLSSWRKSEAERIFAERLGFYHTHYFAHCPKPSLTVREMRSRWGSCRKDTARITLNAWLLGADVRLIDYVVVHELAHLIHADHSPNYWHIVEAVMPDYRIRRAELRRAFLIPPRVDSDRAK